MANAFIKMKRGQNWGHSWWHPLDIVVWILAIEVLCSNLTQLQFPQAKFSENMKKIETSHAIKSSASTESITVSTASF